MQSDKSSTACFSRTLVASVFGIAVIGSGLMRYLGQPNGEKGLWFGVVMGGIALLAAVCFRYGMVTPARVMIWLSILFVGSWFIYEALIKKGFGEAEPRMLVIIGLSVATAVYFLLQYRTDGAVASQQNE